MENWMQGLLLFAFHQMNGERSSRGVVHLLKGRKSNQVMQDAAIFGTALLYGELRKISEEGIEKEIQRLESLQLIQIPSQRSVLCTDKGETILQGWLEEHGLEPCFRSIQTVGQKIEIGQFCLRFELITQTLSHLMQDDSYFLPVVEHLGIQQEVKTIFYQNGDVKRQGAQLKSELFQWMEAIADWERKIILNRLSGKGKGGLTFFQIAEGFGKSQEWVKLQLYRILAEKMKALTSVESPILYQLFTCHSGGKSLSQSAQVTSTLLSRGMDLQNIASLRKLRLGTIEDHVVEIALADPGFQLSSFVDIHKEQQIRNIIQQQGIRKLGEIKKRMGENTSFLEIRLVCATEAVKGEPWKRKGFSMN